MKQKNDYEDMKTAVQQIFQQGDGKAISYKKFLKQMNCQTGKEKQILTRLLRALSDEGIIDMRDNMLRLRQKAVIFEGILDMAASGFGFVKCDDAEQDIFVPIGALNHALHGDTVRVSVKRPKARGRMEGEVVEIVNRGKRSFVGVIELVRGNAFVAVDSRKMPSDIFVPGEMINGAKDGQKVVVRIIEWPAKARSPIGEIVDILGVPGDNDTEMHAILADYELPYHFPREVEAEAEKIAASLDAKEVAKRRDFRKITTLTIDPVDAKDFDDALSIRKLPNGHWEVGVHIADVSHYVRPGTLMDAEAQMRGTSVYLVDRTVPMLPERLSNFVCSLRPDEEKFTYSAVFELDEKAQIQSEWFGRTVILSNRRYTYEQAQAVIDGAEDRYAADILQLHTLAQVSRSRRYAAGAIQFERAEPRFEIDANGKPLSVYFKTQKPANELIEEFMLMANRKVAEVIGKAKLPMVYRVHDTPNPEKFDAFRAFVSKFGYKINPKNDHDIAMQLNQLIGQVRGKPEQNVIETMALRSMAKAIYTTDNRGHYGLAFEYYSHFTSPIRRYPDLMVHRLMTDFLDHRSNAKQAVLEEQCKHASEREQVAAEAERASIKYKMVEFMQDKVGSEFDGSISGVTEWGMYVEITETKIEGMVPLREMTDDYYYFDEEHFCIRGRKHRMKYTLGDKVRIRVLRANMERKQLDYALVTDESRKR